MYDNENVFWRKHQLCWSECALESWFSMDDLRGHFEDLQEYYCIFSILSAHGSWLGGLWHAFNTCERHLHSCLRWIYNGWSYFPCGSSFSSNMSIGTWFDFFSIHLSWLFNFLCFSESSLVCFPPLSSCLSCGLYPPSGWTCWNPPWERSGAVDWIQCL